MLKLVKVVMSLTIVMALSTGVCFAEWLICSPKQVGVAGDRVRMQLTSCKKGNDPATEWNNKFVDFKRGKENQMLATSLTAITLQSELSLNVFSAGSGYAEVKDVFLRND